MIVVKIHSGLGNQMFQYAFALALAIKHETTLVVDASYPLYYPIEIENPKQDYHLDLFSIPHSDFLSLPHSLFKNWLVPERLQKKIYFTRLKDTINKMNVIWIKDDLTKGQEAFSQLPDHCYLDGYFQYPHQFEFIRAKLRNAFTFSKPPLPAQDLEKINLSEISVGVNLRRGDYLKNKNLENIGICTVDYYRTSINYILNFFPNATFFVISDDIADSQQFLEPLKINLHYLNAGSDKHILSDMYLLQQCDHLVLANSTYSWWSAYLSEYDSKKIIIAPDKWFVNPLWSINNSNITPQNWIRMPNDIQS
ncbi:MAG: alpha-1,2-fucosyltransferase [Saprospiraceae bacterium]|nr:alpha-1,2-fucosyltransferase [Saprospiraceae bacterium]